MNDLDKEREEVMIKLFPKRYFWKHFDRIAIENTFKRSYHGRQSEMKTKMIERMCLVSPIERIPLLFDPIFDQLRHEMHSERHRKAVISHSIRSRVRQFTSKLLQDDLSVFYDIDSLIVPLSIAQQGEESRLLSMLTTL